MKRVLVSLVVICSASFGTAAQVPLTTVSTAERQLAAQREQVRLGGVAVQLLELGKQLVQYAEDINQMAHPLAGDCERYSTLMDVMAQADEASSRLDGVSDLLDMYLSISTSSDRIAAGKVLTKHVDEAKHYLEFSIKGINRSALLLPAGAAPTATRIRDDIRSAMDLFDKVKPE